MLPLLLLALWPGQPPTAPLPAGRRECSALCTCGCNDPADKGCRCSGRTAAASPLHPRGEGDTAAGVPNFGIDLDRLGREPRQRYLLGGREVTRAEAVGAIEAPALPDDAGKLRVVVIGPDADRRRALPELAAAWQDRAVLKDYPPEHWAVAKAGFVTTGTPTVYVQAPDGTVLHRQDDYRPGDAAQVAAALRGVQAVRQPRPYDPAKDPDLRKPPPPGPGPILPAPPLPGWAVGAALGLLALLLLLLPRRTTA